MYKYFSLTLFLIHLFIVPYLLCLFILFFGSECVCASFLFILRIILQNNNHHHTNNTYNEKNYEQFR